jgi:hypothetical protein
MVRSVWHQGKPFGWVAVLVIGALGASGLASAQALQPSQIQVYLAPVDAAGAPVTDLKPEEIAMTENGVPGKVVVLERYNLPIKLTIGVDNGKDATPALATVRAALTSLVEALPSDVEVTLVTMSPQPATFVRSTADRVQITRGISRFGVEPDGVPRFSDALVEYADRLEKDFKDKKLTYAPLLLMVSTSQVEQSQAERSTIEKTLKTLATRGARVSLAMFTTRPTDADSIDNLKNGRQALIAMPIIKASGGKFETMAAFNQLSTLLPQWGKEIAASHTKQTTQYRLVLDRPGGATGPLNQPGLRFTRQGLDASISFDGRFVQ